MKKLNKLNPNGFDTNKSPHMYNLKSKILSEENINQLQRTYTECI